MIRMPPLPIGKNDHPRPRLPNHAGPLQPVLPRVLHATVGEIESAPPTNPKNLCRVGGLARAILRRSASAHLALRQVEDASTLPALCRLQQCAAAGLFHIVA